MITRIFVDFNWLIPMLPHIYENIWTLLIVIITFITITYFTISINVWLHEIGHMILGLLFGAKILELRCGNIRFYRYDNKMKIGFCKGCFISGKCDISFPKYNTRISAVLISMGGIISNIITILISVYVILITNGLVNNMFFLIAIYGLLTVPVNLWDFSNKSTCDGSIAFDLLSDKEASKDYYQCIKIKEHLFNSTYEEMDLELIDTDCTRPISNDLKCIVSIYTARHYIANDDYIKAFKVLEWVLQYKDKMKRELYELANLEYIYLSIISCSEKRLSKLNISKLSDELHNVYRKEIELYRIYLAYKLLYLRENVNIDNKLLTGFYNDSYYGDYLFNRNEIMKLQMCNKNNKLKELVG